MLKSAVSSLQSLLGRWKETDLSVRRKRILISLLIILHISPLWVFKYFPTQDGQPHVYNSYVLSVFHDEDSTRLREYYKLNLTLFPNWSSHTFMSLLMKNFPPLIAEKILLSVIISLFPLSLFYFLGAVHKGKNLYGFVGFLFSDHYLLHMGFYSFALSVPLFFFALGYFMKHKEDLSLNKIAILQSVVHPDLLQSHPLLSPSHAFANPPVYHIFLSQTKTGYGTSALYAAVILYHGQLSTLKRRCR